MELRFGEILALLGENGSGKTTLVNMLSGIYQPDAGHINVRGQAAYVASPKDAQKAGHRRRLQNCKKNTGCSCRRISARVKCP